MSNDTACLDCGKSPRGQGGSRGLCRACYYQFRLKVNFKNGLPKPKFTFLQYLAKIVPDENGCWLWPGYVNSNGYGYTERHKPAHVKSYEHHVGPVPEGLDVGHVCHDQDSACLDWRVCMHRRCINPDHLKAQTRSENLRSRPRRN